MILSYTRFVSDVGIFNQIARADVSFTDLATSSYDNLAEDTNEVCDTIINIV